MSNLQTEFDFTLPKGYVDRSGTVHRKGRMRLATAMDEITPLRDPRVRQNQAYHTIILLARVVTHLGTLPAIDTGVIEGLFTADLAFLQELYRTRNELVGPDAGEVRCPSCGDIFVPLSDSMEVAETPGPLA
jgi:predicted Zn finger-like uncharacterized protein